jgi:hypothetical protein
MGSADVKRLEQRCHVAGHALVCEWPIDVARVTVTLQLDRYDLEVVAKLRQQRGEAALDRPERPVEQHERVAGTVALVVHRERTNVDVARRLTSPHAWTR